MMKTIKRIGALTLIVTMVLSMVVPVYGEEIIGTREETVYGLLNADGSTDKIIVTEHIQKDKTLETIELESNLENILLLMDSVDYKKDGKTLSFTTKESDIYFRGESKAALPVTTEIVYELDGEIKEVKDIVGKSGHLKVTIKQINHEKRIFEFNGESEELYLPFETAVVMNLDNDIYENVMTDYGMILDDGGMKVFTVVLTPGLEFLFDTLDSEYITDTVVIEAHVKDFKMSSIYMTTLCKLPSIDLSQVMGELSDVKGKVDEFSDAGSKLLSGTQQLKVGVDTYFGEQVTAFEQFNYYLSNDEKLLRSIVDFNSNFVDFDTALNLYTSGLAELLAGITDLSDLSPALSAGMTSLKAGLESFLPKNAQTANLFATVEQLNAGTKQLNAGLQKMKAGAVVISEKTEALTTASGTLKTGSNQLFNASSQLLGGNNKLVGGLSGLADASIQVTNGMNSLEVGVRQFKIDGIDTLVGEVESSLEKIEVFQSKYEALLEEVEKYNSFTGDVNHLESQLIFIMKTKSVK